VGQNRHLTAFEWAKQAVQATGLSQEPWLDDNGDGIYDEAIDGQEAQRRGFAYAGTLVDEEWPPFIVQATGPTTIQQGQGVIRANVLDDVSVRRVWAAIYPPSYQPPSPPREDLVSETLPTIVLLDQGNGWYGAAYTGFNEIGVYRVVIYAEDNTLLGAQPVSIEVQTGWKVFLPVVLKD